MDKLSAVFTRQEDGSVIYECKVDEGQVAMACCYARQLSNKEQKHVDLTLTRSTVTYSFAPDTVSSKQRKTNNVRKTNDSPSVIEFLNSGD